MALTKPKTIEYAEGYSWDTSSTWYPSSLATALQEADGGSMTSAADICDAMMADDRIKSVLSTRTNALLGCELDFESDRAAPKKAIAKDWYRWATEAELSKIVRWGTTLGVGLGATKWTEHDGRWIPRLRCWHPRNLNYDFTKDQWYVYDRTSTRIDIADDDPYWWLYLPYGEYRPWADGTWRALCLYWLGKSYAWRDWNRHNEIHGSAALVGKASEGSSPADRQKFWTDLKSIGSKARIVLPAGYSLEVLEADAAAHETFDSLIARADTAIAIVHLGQNLTTEVDGGSYAATVAHGTVRQDYLESDAELLSTSAHDGPWAHWARFNFGNPDMAPWARWQTKPPEDLKSKADTLNVVADALTKLVAVAPQVDVEAILEQHQIPIRDGATFEEPKAPSQPPPAQQPPPEHVEEPDEDEEPEETLDAPQAVVRLASGGAAPPALVRGQKYVDGLVASGRDATAAQLSPWLDQVLGIIDGLEDGPDWPTKLRAKLVAAYGDGPELEEIIERAMILAELAGRVAVIEDL